ncbi:Haloacetate dehalogenase H-1 [Labrenzia sp. THAF82]|uniref:alpha/beta fold hydrolase n=1 Tax=Labrenzia sp. THAF82 TaxID=2587861 RepID=UPI001267D48D|nr:alpha/beta hydrolase [Labrenzia sp. THAF82]QFT29821.1 Haloacetate dehalogenase H-1 [Labrenzia sp. THAF82]
MTWQTPQTFDFEGHSIRWGSLGVGTPLVMMHGTPFWSHEWSRLAPLLANSHTVFFYDMLGYGNSDRPDGDVSLGIQNRLFAALTEHWKLDRPDVVAHDFGGATALRAHLIDAVDYNSLTLIDPVALRPWGSPLVQHVKHHETAFAEMPSYMHEAILPAYLQSAMHHKAGREVLTPYADQWVGAEKQAAFYRQIAQMDQRYTDEVQDRYAEIRCPVQILWGEEDEWIPIDRGRELHAMIPGSSFVSIPNAGHLMQEDAPEAIAFHVQSFLQAQHRAGS